MDIKLSDKLMKELNCRKKNNETYDQLINNIIKENKKLRHYLIKCKIKQYGVKDKDLLFLD